MMPVFISDIGVSGQGISSWQKDFRPFDDPIAKHGIDLSPPEKNEPSDLTFFDVLLTVSDA